MLKKHRTSLSRVFINTILPAFFAVTGKAALANSHSSSLHAHEEYENAAAIARDKDKMARKVLNSSTKKASKHLNNAQIAEHQFDMGDAPSHRGEKYTVDAPSSAEDVALKEGQHKAEALRKSVFKNYKRSNASLWKLHKAQSDASAAHEEAYVSGKKAGIADEELERKHFNPMVDLQYNKKLLERQARTNAEKMLKHQAAPPAYPDAVKQPPLYQGQKRKDPPPSYSPYQPSQKKHRNSEE